MITLPWAVLCRDNARHGLMRGRILLTKEYRSALAAASQLAAIQWRTAVLTDRVAVTVTLHEPDRRRRDVGNYVKMIADALIGTALVDDSQIDDLRLLRGERDRENPRAEIEIRAL